MPINNHSSGGGGPHTHPQSEVTDLTTDLGNKAASNHNHSGVYATSSHTHAQSDITNLVTDLADKASTGTPSYVNGSINTREDQ